MPKRIYVGLSKMSSTELDKVARRCGIARDRLDQAARGKITLTQLELSRVSKAVATDPGSVADGR